MAMQHEVKISMPDMGLSEKEMDHLKKKFEHEVIQHLGGKDAMEQRAVIVVVIIVVVQ